MPAEALPLLLAERSTAKLSATLVDENGDPVPKADLGSMTVTLYLSTDPRVIINNRNAQNVLDANGGAYHDTNGAFTWTMAPLDNVIVGGTPSGGIETHVALFKWTWGSGKGGNQEFLVRVEARHRVP